MSRLKLVVDDKIPFLKGVLDSHVDVIYLPGAKITAEDVKDADAIFTRTRTKCNESLLNNSRVKLIVTATIGYDHIDTDYCDAAGIRWVNAPGCNSGSVQQYITAAIATLVWQLNLRFSELTRGIIGVGHVGSKVEQVASALGMRVLLNDPPRADKEGPEAFTSLDRLLSESDIVTIHTPLTKEAPYPTYHLASGDFFNRMKYGAAFINTSRGPVTDTQALIHAVNDLPPYETSPSPLFLHPPTPIMGGLDTSKADNQPATFLCPLQMGRKLSGFILDVWEGEPHPDASLLTEAFIGTPHIAGYSSDGKANGTAACIREFCTFFGLTTFNDWRPESIPPPPMASVFSLDGTGKSPEQIIFEAVTHTYPIWKDSARLKSSPRTFEEQRGSYRTRREFKNFTVIPVNIPAGILATLQKIGFIITF